MRNFDISNKNTSKSNSNSSTDHMLATFLQVPTKMPSHSKNPALLFKPCYCQTNVSHSETVQSKTPHNFNMKSVVPKINKFGCSIISA